MKTNKAIGNRRWAIGKKQIIRWIFCSLLLQTAANAQVPSVEFPAEFFKKEITAITITGNMTREELQQLRQLSFQTQVGKKSSPEKLRHDLATMYAQGFIANLSAKPVFSEKQRDILIEVTANAVISQIVFENLRSLSPQKLLEKTQLKLGQRLNYQKLAVDIQTINQKLISEGYELSYVKKSEFQEASQTLVYQIHETRIGQLLIRGNELHPSQYLLREIWTKPGDLYNVFRLREDRFILLKLGYLQGVSNPTVMPTNQSDQVDVIFRVVEQKSNTLQMGLGYTDLDSNRFVFTNLNLLNTLGGGENISLRFQVGLKTVSGLDATAFTYRVRYSNMLFPDQKISWAVEKSVDTGPENLSQGGVIAASAIDIKRDSTAFELAMPVTTKTKFVSSLRLMHVLNTDPDAALKGITTIDYDKNSWINIFRYEDIKRDPYQNPFSGLSGVLRAEKSFGLMLGDGTLPFEKYDITSTFYSLLWSEQDIFMFNVAAGQVVFPSNRIVAEGELYKMGGPSTVRGYVPPRYIQIGSKKLQFNSEWRHIFNETFSSLLFFDYGGAYDDNLFENAGVLLGNSFGYGMGVGLRANTPIGAMEVDLAQNKDGQQLIHLSLGATF